MSAMVAVCRSKVAAVAGRPANRHARVAMSFYMKKHDGTAEAAPTDVVGGTFVMALT
jgi:hypothetical protein